MGDGRREMMRGREREREIRRLRALCQAGGDASSPSAAGAPPRPSRPRRRTATCARAAGLRRPEDAAVGQPRDDGHRRRALRHAASLEDDEGVGGREVGANEALDGASAAAGASAVLLRPLVGGEESVDRIGTKIGLGSTRSRPWIGLNLTSGRPLIGDGQRGSTNCWESAADRTCIDDRVRTAPRSTLHPPGSTPHRPKTNLG